MTRSGAAALAFAAALLVACERVPGRPAAADSAFLDGSEIGELQGANLREASGIVASRRFPGHFWLHNDSGGDPELVLIDSTGVARMRLRVPGVENRDWEDVAARGDTLFIAEMGDNSARYDTVYVYAVLEPAVIADTTAAWVGRYPFRFPDGPRDAETLLVDPLSGDWFIVSKREEQSRLYRYAASQRTATLPTLERVEGSFAFRMAVGGDVSIDGREVLVKTYDAVYHWQRNGGESLAATLLRPPRAQPYTPERQGEAIAFTTDGSAYVTTSEVELDAPQLLLRYARRPR